MAAAAKIFSLTVTNIALLSYSLLYLLKLKYTTQYYSLVYLKLSNKMSNVMKPIKFDDVYIPQTFILESLGHEYPKLLFLKSLGYE